MYQRSLTLTVFHEIIPIIFQETIGHEYKSEVDDYGVYRITQENYREGKAVSVLN
jgi:hypothetical protein